MAILTFSLTNDTIADADQVMELLLELEAVLDGGITTSNLASGFTLDAQTQLTNNTAEIILPLNYDFSVAATVGLKALIPLPGNGTYTIQNVQLAIYNPDAATPLTNVNLTGGTPASGNTFVIEAGTITAGAWVVSNTIVSTTQFYSSATATIAAGTVVTSSEAAPVAIGLRVTAVNTPPTSGKITAIIRATRSLQ